MDLMWVPILESAHEFVTDLNKNGYISERDIFVRALHDMAGGFRAESIISDDISGKRSSLSQAKNQFNA